MHGMGGEEMVRRRGPWVVVDQAPPIVVSGARRLWLAVLESAIMDGDRGGPVAAEARGWVQDPDGSWLGSFPSICDVLDLAPSTVRAWMAARSGSTPRTGVNRAAYVGDRAPARRRLLSATLARACVQCDAWFTTAWGQQRACSAACARRHRKARAKRTEV